MERKLRNPINCNNVIKLVFWILIAVGLLIIRNMPESYNYRTIIISLYNVALLFTFCKGYSAKLFNSIFTYTLMRFIITIVLGLCFAELTYLGIRSLPIYYLVLILINTVIWSYFCLKYDLKKGKIANLIISLLIGLLILVNSFVWNIFESLKIMPFTFKDFCLPNQNIYQSHMVLFYLILFPIFTMTSVTAIAIEIKEYILEKKK